MMRYHRLIIIFAIFLGACDRQEDAQDNAEVKATQTGAPVSEAGEALAAQWSLQTDLKGAELALKSRSGARIVTFSCPSGEKRLMLNVPGFTAIGSEERMSFGSGGEVEALVADFRGDRQRGGVTAEGAVPSNLALLIGGSVSASYGAQTSGPHPAIPRDIATAFVAACRSGAAGQSASADQTVSPCLMQDGKRLSVQPLRAVGNEPFWGAKIEGRCVTYSHPEDQQGTRVWTKYTATSQGGLWSGALGGRLFELRTRAEPGCSDGMSDKTYPLSVELLVNGERRQGCAEPM